VTDDDWRAAPGAGLIRASRASTALFTVLAVAAAAFPDDVARPVAVVDVVLFAVGTVAFLAAFARAVGRSRTEQVDILGVYLLGGGVAPAAVRRQLVGCVVVQSVVAVATAAVRPYTSVAFGVLVPMLGLGLAGLWGATHGSFGPRSSPATHARPSPDDEAD
jgi:hypothetical protein